jgi:hypothetical protein
MTALFLIVVAALLAHPVYCLFTDWRANHRAEDHFWIDRAARRQL